MTPEQGKARIEVIVGNITGTVSHEVASRTYRASNELTNAVKYVLAGQRHGRRYKVPGTYRRQLDKATGKMRNGVWYTASAPGEAPANRTGHFRLSFKRRVEIEGGADGLTAHAITESDLKVKKGYLLGEILEQGTKNGKIAPRPYKQRTIDRAMPAIKRIYSQRYIY